MKMELALKAPFAGTVVSVAAGAGQQVDLGTELLRVLREGSCGPLDPETLHAGQVGSGPASGAGQ
jgi:hypothetical protein